MRAADNLAEEKLMVEAAQADPGRFSALYESNFARVYAYVFRRVKDRALAEDLTAEVFRQAFTQIGRFEWRGTPFSAWLLRISANLITDHWRSRSSGREVPFDETLVAGEELKLDRAALLTELMDSLPPDQRLVIARRFLDERSIRDIAKEMGRSEGAIKQLQFRALQNMREKLRSSHG